MTTTSTWLDFALQQLAAESYLDAVTDFDNADQLAAALELGANHPNPQVARSVEHTTRMTPSQAESFAARYQIVDHLPNQASGFSATLIRNRQSGDFTLAFRSLEFRRHLNGGDRERDGAGAAAELAEAGFAFGQLSDMETYYGHLLTSGTLPPDATLNVTGYSLGGFLATVFTELHSEAIEHTYTFNGAGRGTFDSALGSPADLVDFYERVRADPAAGLAEGAEPGPEFLAAEALAEAPLPSTDESLYLDPRHQWAVIATQRAFATRGTLDVERFALDVHFDLVDGAEDRITTLIGQATQDDSEWVAGSGVNAKPEISVFIEDQPDATGLGPAASLIEQELEKLGLGELEMSGNFGSTHSIVLMIDSLALIDAFQSVDPELSRAKAEEILAAASDARAAGGLFGGRAEGNSLEIALDALRRIVLGPHGLAPTPFSDAPLGFGDPESRESFHRHVAEVKRAAATLPELRIESLVFASAAEIATRAEDSLAYRHALVELNPFALEGADGLYAPYRAGLTGLGPEYLADRAEFLSLYLRENESPVVFNDGNATARHFEDRPSGRSVRQADPSEVEQVLFGGPGPDLLLGGDREDHIYAGSGDDHVSTGAGDDLLFGGGGADRLVGDAGHDTYHVTAGDFLTDRDGAGTVRWMGETLAGGWLISPAALSGDTDYFASEDGRFIYQLRGDTLRVFDRNEPGMITIEGYNLGDLGLTLSAAPALPPGASPLLGTSGDDAFVVPHPTHPGPYDRVITFDGDDQVAVGSSLYPGLIIDTGAGHDIVRLDTDDVLENVSPSPGEGASVDTGSGNDFVDGGLGDDTVRTAAGHDTVFAHAGRDTISGGEQNDFLEGQDGADFVAGDRGRDFVLGGAGADILLGGGDADTLYGDAAYLLGQWDGAAETIHTFDTLPTGGERLGVITESPASAHDVLDGGTGDDRLFGGLGDDVLLGGDGADWLEGEGGDDTLFGGADDDRLFGDKHPETIEFDHAVIDTGLGDLDDLAWTIQFRIHQDEPEVTGNDSLFGEAGSDWLFGLDGDDRLAGGPGDDRLEGGPGDDTYEFGRDDGHDTVLDAAGGADRIRFERDIDLRELVLEPEGADLRITFTDVSADALTILEWNEPGHRIEFLEFGDGTVLKTGGEAFDLDEHQLQDGVLSAGGPGLSAYRFIPTLADDFSVDLRDAGGIDRLTFARHALDAPPELGAKFISSELEGYSRIADDLRLEVALRSDLAEPARFGEVTIAGYFTDSGFVETIVFPDGPLRSPRRPPVATGMIPDRYLDLDSRFDETLPADLFSDDDLDLLVMSATLANGEPLPGWLGFDPSTETFQGTPTTDDRGILPVVVTATDRDGQSASAGFTVFVGFHPPELATPIPDIVTEAFSPVDLRVAPGTFVDADPDDRLRLGASLADGSALPEWLSFDPVSGRFSGIPRLEQAGVLELEVTAADAIGLHASDRFLLGIVNTSEPATLIVGGPENDVLEGSPGVDVMHGGAGADELAGGDGGDIIEGAQGADLLLGQGGDDRLSGGSGDDHVQGDGGDDRLRGGPGDDALFGLAGNDLLDGGTGTDHLEGGSGDDRFRGSGGDTTYVYGPGSLGGGRDVIRDDGGNDRIRITSLEDLGVSPATFPVLRVNQDLVLELDAYNRVTIEDWFTSTVYQIETFHFPAAPSEPCLDGLSDGCVRLSAAEMETRAVTVDVNDPPAVLAGIDDQIAQQDRRFSFTIPGDAFTDPDAGDSLSFYAFDRGSGDDEGGALASWIGFDETTGEFTGTPANEDVGSYAIGVFAFDRERASAFDEFVLEVVNVNDPPVIEIPVADLVTEVGRAFHFPIPAGTFTDPDDGEVLSLTVAEAHGAPLPAWLAFDRASGELTGTPSPADAGMLDLEIVATDGAGASAGDRFSLTVMPLGDQSVTGTSGADVMVGGAGDDWLVGRGGDDRILGGPGSDVLRGGSGNDLIAGGSDRDRLSGGAGDDAYDYRLGDGVDRIVDRGGDADRVTFGPGIEPDRLWFWRHRDHLEVGVIGERDRLTIGRWFSDPSFRIEGFESSAESQVLLERQVQQLVDAMAVYRPSHHGELSVPADLREELAPVIAAAWESA